MNTLKKIIAVQLLNRSASTVGAVALERSLSAWAISGSVRLRQWLAVALIAAGVGAAITYVIAVNAILLHGEAVKRERRAVSALEQEYAALQARLLARQSPAWLEAEARRGGMVAVTGIRYLTAHQSVALSR